MSDRPTLSTRLRSAADAIDRGDLRTAYSLAQGVVRELGELLVKAWAGEEAPRG
jgi:hypothetical protein